MRFIVMATLAGAVAFSLTAQAADGRRGPRHYSARLVSYQEVPALSSPAVGEIDLVIDDAAQTIAYRLRFTGLVADVRQAHIHFAQRGVNGGIMLWLCGTATNPGPAGTPVCPASGEISGMLGPAEVIGPAGQGIAAAEFDEAAAAIRAGAAYANVHSATYAGGEIRGQLRLGGGRK